METHSPVDRDQRKQSCNVDMRFNFAVGAIAIAAAIVLVYLIVVAV